MAVSVAFVISPLKQNSILFHFNHLPLVIILCPNVSAKDVGVLAFSLPSAKKTKSPICPSLCHNHVDSSTEITRQSSLAHLLQCLPRQSSDFSPSRAPHACSFILSVTFVTQNFSLDSYHFQNSQILLLW